MTKKEAISLLDGEIIRCRMAPKINGCEHYEGIWISRPPQSWCYVEEV